MYLLMLYVDYVKCFHNFNSTVKKLRKFLDFQLLDDDELPRKKEVDKFWGSLGKKEALGKLSFQNVCKLMKAILCIPHSNAFSERTFSMVRKIVTENRTDIGNDTVCALSRCILNCDKRACEYKPTKDELKAAKSATYLYNQVHSKK